MTMHSGGRNAARSRNFALMGQLASNLVSNAVQHGDPNTPVKNHDCERRRGLVTLNVENQGPAIPSDRRLSMFDPLNRTSEATSHGRGGSLGRGLYIAKEIALAHGGGIKLVSSDESGTRFSDSSAARSATCERWERLPMNSARRFARTSPPSWLNSRQTMRGPPAPDSGKNCAS